MYWHAKNNLTSLQTIFKRILVYCVFVQIIFLVHCAFWCRMFSFLLCGAGKLKKVSKIL